MNPTPLLRTSRAISAEFAGRIYKPILIIASIVLAVLIIIAIVLVSTIGLWLLLLLIPLLLVAILFAFVAIVVGFLLKLLKPLQTKSQQLQISAFVDKLQDVADTISTPKFVLLFRLLKDTAFPNEQGLVQQMTGHAKSLKPDFQAIVTSFKDA